MAARKRGTRKSTGPKKVRIPGTNRWVLPDELELLTAADDEVVDELLAEPDRQKDFPDESRMHGSVSKGSDNYISSWVDSPAPDPSPRTFEDVVDDVREELDRSVAAWQEIEPLPDAPDDDEVPPEFVEPVPVNPDLGPRPEPDPVVVETRTYPHYWHAWLPHLTIRRGRKDQIRFKGGVYQPRSASQEAAVRKALVKYVPGGDPDRWMGDSLWDDDEDAGLPPCIECGFTTANRRVMKDHMQHTQHDKSARIDD